MKTILCLLVGSVAIPSLFAALNPTDDVRTAIARLGEKPNYSWVTATRNNTPAPTENAPEGEGPGRLRQALSQLGPIEAKTVRAGITELKSTMNDGTVVQVAFKDDKAIVKTKDGWKPLEAFRAEFRPRDPASGEPGQPPGPRQGPGFGGQRGPGGFAGEGFASREDAPGRAAPREDASTGFGRNRLAGVAEAGAGGQAGAGFGPGAMLSRDPSAFMAQRLRMTRPPTVEAQELLDRVQNLKMVSVGHYVGDLPGSSLRDMMMGGRRGGGQRGGGREGQDNPNPFQPRTEGTKATAKFWTSGGVLTKYETSIQTKITIPVGEVRELNIDLKNTTEIRQIGTSRLDLSKDAFTLLLGPSQPAPQPSQPAQRPPPQRPAPPQPAPE